MDNRERATARDKKRRPISLKEKHENFIAAVRMLAATKVKMKEMYIKSVLHVQSRFYAN